jgi:hypothetical protein
LIELMLFLVYLYVELVINFVLDISLIIESLLNLFLTFQAPLLLHILVINDIGVRIVVSFDYLRCITVVVLLRGPLSVYFLIE